MKTRALLALLLAMAGSAPAEDVLKADVDGTAEVFGIADDGTIVGDGEASFGRHPVSGKLRVVTREGRVHRVETYFDWSAINGVRARVWERLYVSGGTYTGWSERLIQTPETISFSRTVIDGDFEQEIEPSGSGFVEWTVSGADNGVEPAELDESDDEDLDVTATDENESLDGTLPTVEILEEGELDGVSDRRIDIDADGDESTLRFRDNGYTRIEVGDGLLTVTQKVKLEGEGEGSLRFEPRERESSPSPTPTPIPGATPTATPAPTPFLAPTPTPFSFGF